MDLRTLKSKYVRGTEWTKKVEKSNDSIMYRNLISANGKVYYTTDKKIEEDLKLYQYQENGKDIEKCRIDCDIPTYNSSELVLEQYDEEKNQSTLYLYHFKTGKKEKVSKLSDCSMIGFIEDDIILYKRNSDEEKERSGYMYSSYSVLRIH